MKGFFNKLISNWNIAALLLGMAAWVCFMGARLTGSPLYWSLLVIFACTAAGLVMRMPWARLVGLVLLCGLCGLKTVELVRKGFTSNRLIQAAALGFVAHALWRRPNNGIVDDWKEMVEDDTGKPNGPDGASEEEPLISLVHLRTEPRYLEAAVLANALSEAWGLKLASAEASDADDDTTDGFVAGGNPIYVVMVNKPKLVVFTVHNHASPYFDDVEKMVELVPNLRFKEVIREHQAWMAVDLIKAPDTEVAQEKAYLMIGKALAALADDKVLAICCPQNDYFNLWSAELEEVLRGDEPLEALKTEVKAPVYGVPSGDLLAAAVAEARRRWPEFAEAFRRREPGDDRFIVKAPFTGEDGGVEHMWIQVFGLEPEFVHGHLVNDPMHSRRLKKGSQVEVPVSEVSDWLCPSPGGGPLGNFTDEAVRSSSRRG